MKILTLHLRISRGVADELECFNLYRPPSSLTKGRKHLTLETQQFESPYCLKIETRSGQTSTIPIAFLTPKQLEVFLQTEFKRLAQEAGAKGVRVHVERAVAADYEQVLREVSACLQSATKRAA